MKLHELKPPEGAKTARRRVGRGLGSGRGKTSGKGMKGQKSRSGGKIPLYFEGGQLPLVRRLPYRRGFNNPFRVEYEVVNLDQLATLDAKGEVTPDVLRAAGLVRRNHKPVKVLARGTLDRAVTVHAHAFSAAAREAIQAAGGTVTVLGAPAVAEETPPVVAARSAPAPARAPRRARAETAAPSVAESASPPRAASVSSEAPDAVEDGDATVTIPAAEEKPPTESTND
jgi:large subunit ribosomal protein L15